MQGWALADSWPFSPPLGAMKPFTLMAVVPATGAFYLDGTSTIARVAFAIGSVVGAYLFISLLFYLVIRQAKAPTPRREVDREAAGALAPSAEAFGEGIGIAASQWHFFNDNSDDLVAVAAMPDFEPRSIVAISPNESSLGDDGYGVDFLGRRSAQRLLIVSQEAPILPIKNLDWAFDTRSDSQERWTWFGELLNSSEHDFDVADFSQWRAEANLAKEAGFLRFARTWGRSMWRRRGLVRGFPSKP